jgi:hypothetical protein
MLVSLEPLKAPRKLWLHLFYPYFTWSFSFFLYDEIDIVLVVKGLYVLFNVLVHLFSWCNGKFRFVGNLELCGLPIQRACRGTLGFPAVLPHSDPLSSSGKSLFQADCIVEYIILNFV